MKTVVTGPGKLSFDWKVSCENRYAYLQVLIDGVDLADLSERELRKKRSEIGMIFGKTENWARVTYHRARLKLQERMDAR